MIGQRPAKAVKISKKLNNSTIAWLWLAACGFYHWAASWVLGVARINARPGVIGQG